MVSYGMWWSMSSLPVEEHYVGFEVLSMRSLPIEELCVGFEVLLMSSLPIEEHHAASQKTASFIPCLLFVCSCTLIILFVDYKCLKYNILHVFLKSYCLIVI